MRKTGVLVLLFSTVLTLFSQPHLQAAANDFSFSSFDADYYLSSDQEGRSTLKTVERFTAQFPQADQNHGIERAIPTSYDNHPTSLKIESVTDENQRPIEYKSRNEDGNQILRVGDADIFVRGQKTYVITYSQRDVTKFFPAQGDTEFYWDTNGTQWKQPFAKVTARVHLSDSVGPTFTKKMSCYKGSNNSTQSCGITQEGNTITATAQSLAPGENVTLALGFAAGTWRGYEMSAQEKVFATLTTLWVIAQAITTPLGIGLVIWMSIRYYRLKNRDGELGTIVAEYLPPKEASVLVSAQIADDARTTAATTAQIIDFAVRHVIKMYQTSEKSLLKSAEYELEIVSSIDQLSKEEKKLLSALFNDTSIGTRVEMKKLKSNMKFVTAVTQNTKTVTQDIQGDYAFRQRSEEAIKVFNRLGHILWPLAILTLSPALLIAFIIALTSKASLYPLTDSGLALRRYLAGLKLYIGVAEQERLKMLQSPQGAQKVGQLSGDDTKQLVKLYEKVLPYAILFGQEGEWNKQLGGYYEQAGTTPDWYVGHSAFNAALFTTALSDFGTNMNSYSSPTNSSTGGAGGGGYSGGGGGGGGGGGW